MQYSPSELTNRAVIDFKNLDAVFLDLDDTIVEYRNSCIAGLSQLSKHVPGLSSTDIDALEQEFREILRANLPALMDGVYSIDGERRLRLETILSRHGIAVNPDLLELCDHEFQEGFWNSRNLLEGAEGILQACRDEGIPIAVITNGDYGMQKRTLKMLSLDRYVDYLITPGSSSELKPSTTLFEKALSLTGADRRRTIMIGDTWHQDIIGALETGITPVWLNRWQSKLPDGQSVIEVHSLSDLIFERNGGGSSVQ